MKKIILIVIALTLSIFAEERFNDKIESIAKGEKPKEYVGKSKKKDVKEEMKKKHPKKVEKKPTKKNSIKKTDSKTKKSKEIENILKEDEDDVNLTPNMKLFKSLINKVKARREGIDELKINLLKNPFSLSQKAIDELKKEEEAKINVANAMAAADKNASMQLNLLGIFDNKVNINGKWYKLNDTVFGNKIRKIGRGSIMIESSKGVKSLYLRKKHIKEQR